MSAAAVRKKPATPERTTPVEGFFSLGHEQLAQAAVLCPTRTELLVVLWISSKANQRARNGRSDGWTGIEQSEAIAAFAGVDVRMVNYALESLSERGVIEQKTVKQAQRAKLIPSEEARASNYFGSLLRVAFDEWAEIIAGLAAAKIAEDAAAKAEAAKEEAAEDVAVHRTVLLPGRKSEPVSLPAEVRRRLATVEAIEADTSTPVAIDLAIVGRSLHFTVAEPDTKWDQVRKHISSAQSKGVTSEKGTVHERSGRRNGKQAQPLSKDDEVRADEIGLRLAVIGAPVDKDMAVAVAQVIRDEDTTVKFIRDVHQARLRKGSGFQSGLVLKIARDAASKAEYERKAAEAAAGETAAANQPRREEGDILDLLTRARAKNRASE